MQNSKEEHKKTPRLDKVKLVDVVSYYDIWVNFTDEVPYIHSSMNEEILADHSKEEIIHVVNN